MHRGKVYPGVIELPRGNELSRDHVNRPLDALGNIKHASSDRWSSGNKDHNFYNRG